MTRHGTPNCVSSHELIIHQTHGLVQNALQNTSSPHGGKAQPDGAPATHPHGRCAASPCTRACRAAARGVRATLRVPAAALSTCRPCSVRTIISLLLWRHPLTPPGVRRQWRSEGAAVGQRVARGLPMPALQQ